MKNKYMFGADPEVFLADEYGKIVPAYEYIPEKYTKGHCLPFDTGGIHPDNIMLELNPEPSPGFYSVLLNCYDLMNYSSAYFRDNYGINLNTIITPLIDFKDLQKDLAGHSKFMEFGCEPDWDAYRQRMNPQVTIEDNIRVAGGHIMISAQDERLGNKEIACLAVRWFDYLLLPLINNRESFNLEQTRRKWYGKAGSFRPKKFSGGYFGLEYRVPSNYWLIQDDHMRNRADIIAEHMVEGVEKAFSLEEPPVDQEEIIELINNIDKDKFIEFNKAA